MNVELRFVVYLMQLNFLCMALTGIIFFSLLKCFNCTLLDNFAKPLTCLQYLIINSAMLTVIFI